MTNQPKEVKKKEELFDNPLEVREHPVVKEMPDRAKGTQRIYKFQNGYGASVVRLGWSFLTTGEFNYGSYTSNENEWELAVIKWDGDSYQLDYSTPITEDVMGHLSREEVEEVLNKIFNL